MDHALLVSVVERAGDLPRDAERVLQREPALPDQPVPQRFPLHEGHRVPEILHTGVVRPCSTGVEHGQDVGMLEASGEADLALEPLGAGLGGEVGEQDLEGDRTVVAEIACEVDHAHAAAAELALDGVAVGERLANLLRHGHARAPGRKILVKAATVSKRPARGGASNPPAAPTIRRRTAALETPTCTVT